MTCERSVLDVGKYYNLVGHAEKNLLVLRKVADPYSEFTYRVRSSTTGWTMTIHGVNMYSDGSIDWDFSTNGYYTEMEN